MSTEDRRRSNRFPECGGTQHGAAVPMLGELPTINKHGRGSFNAYMVVHRGGGAEVAGDAHTQHRGFMIMPACTKNNCVRTVCQPDSGCEGCGEGRTDSLHYK